MPIDTTITIKQRDTYRLSATLEHPETGDPYDLTDANEVRLYVEHSRSETLVVDSPVEILDAAAGEVAYDFSRAETALNGVHYAEFVVDESTAEEDDYTTVPDDGYVKLDFTKKLSREVDAEPADIRGDWEVTRLTATESVRSPAGRFAEQLGFPVYTADADAPLETGYFNETDGQLKYKDDGGGVHAGDGGLLAGEDFDGQGTSSFQNLDSVGTDSQQIGGAGVGTTTQLGPTAMDRKGLPPFPTDFQKVGPLIGGDGIDHAGFVSAFHASAYLQNPLDEWYLYWTGHDDKSISLSSTSDLIDPSAYTHHGTVLHSDNITGVSGHIASPSVIWNEANGALDMFYHGVKTVNGRNVQYTRVATSPDGETWSDEQTVLDAPGDGVWDGDERTYLRVMRQGDGYIGVYQGRDEGANPGIGYAWSDDGRNWSTLDHPLFYNQHLDSVVGSYDVSTFQHGSPTLTEWGGQLWVLESIRPSSGTGEIYAVPLSDVEQQSATPIRLFGPSESWELDRNGAPTVVFADGKMIVLYHTVASGATTEHVGAAYTDLGGY